MKTLRTRREFLNGTLLGAGAAFTAPAFLHQTMSVLHAAEADRAVQAVTGRDAPILVVLQLAGGNDGLNTIVPHGDDAYYKARPRLAVSKKSILTLNDAVGLAPQLAFLKASYDDGRLAIVQGVGYPNPNRSHFRSTEIWECATDAGKVSKTGWLGRYFDNQCAGLAVPDPTVGVAVSREQPQAFFAEKNSGISLSSPQAYRWASDKDPAALSLFADLNGPDTGMMSGASIGIPGGKAQPKSESTLDFLERTALDARVSSDKITSISGKSSPGAYPQSQLAQSLSLVSRMIAGGLTARVYYVTHGGFDTHNNQSGTHQRLLTELDAALKAFFTDLKTQGHADRVCLMTFSEFGRRVAENASAGTDHGTAAPLFVMGAGVKPGLYGQQPSLTDLDKGDLKFTTDFRSVYATVLNRWLKTPAAKILEREFPDAGFMA
jgi:uncharacterized protein (DUF1501 family)